MGDLQVVLSAMIDHALGAGRRLVLAERPQSHRMVNQEGRHEIGQPPHQAEGAICAQVKAAGKGGELFGRARLEIGGAHRLAGRGRSIGQHVPVGRIVLVVTEGRDGADDTLQRRIGSDVGDDLAVDMEPAAVAQGIDVLFAGLGGHVLSSEIGDGDLCDRTPGPLIVRRRHRPNRLVMQGVAGADGGGRRLPWRAR
jgi:hypothetical protein